MAFSNEELQRNCSLCKGTGEIRTTGFLESAAVNGYGDIVLDNRSESGHLIAKCEPWGTGRQFGVKARWLALEVAR